MRIRLLDTHESTVPLITLKMFSRRLNRLLSVTEVLSLPPVLDGASAVPPSPHSSARYNLRFHTNVALSSDGYDMNVSNI